MVQVETLFLDAVLRLLDEDVCLPDKQAITLQNLAFPWIIKSETYVPLVELSHQRQRVTSQCALIIGRLSRFRLKSIIAGFQEILQKRLDVRTAWPSALACIPQTLPVSTPRELVYL